MKWGELKWYEQLLGKFKVKSVKAETKGLVRDGRKRIPVRGRFSTIYGVVLPIGGMRNQGGGVIHPQTIGAILEVHHGLCEALFP